MSRYLLMDTGESLYFLGYRTGDLEIHYENKEFLVIKERGRKVWSAVGSPRGYSRAEFWILRKLSDWKQKSKDGYRWREIELALVLTFPVKKGRS